MSEIYLMYYRIQVFLSSHFAIETYVLSVYVSWQTSII